MSALSIRGLEPFSRAWWWYLASSLAAATLTLNTWRIAEHLDPVTAWTVGVSAVLAGLGAQRVLMVMGQELGLTVENAE